MDHRFTVTVRRQPHVAPRVYRCDTELEAAELSAAFHAAYYPQVEVQIIDAARVAAEFIEQEAA